MTATVPREFDIVITFEQDDPCHVAALDFAQQTISPLPGLQFVWIETSHLSEDQTILNDQHHDIRARFTVSADSADSAAKKLLAMFDQVHSRDRVTGIAVNGNWLDLDPLADRYEQETA